MPTSATTSHLHPIRCVLRIALVHSFYRSDVPSGENLVVLRQAAALRSAGHEVLVVARYSDHETRGSFHGLRSAIHVATGLGPDPTPELRAFGPDVVHVHNLFPNFGEQWVTRWDGPLVATLHNFRSLCANGLLYRDTMICTACAKGVTIPAIRYACYRGSRLATLPLAVHNAGGLRRNRLILRADRIILLSDRSEQVFAWAGGIKVGRKIVVVPNGVIDQMHHDRGKPEHWAFIGRLSHEKGIRELVEAWPESEFLRVAGDGPLLADLTALRRPGVELLGTIPPEAVDDLLRRSWGLIFSSRCLETGGPPLTVAEASMNGVPVLARSGSSAADYVERTGAGLTYGHESELPERLRSIRELNGELSLASRSAFAAELSTDAWLDHLERVYAEAARSHAAQ